MTVQGRRAATKGADSKTRLILAAERLFAKGGIDGVSLREIATAAGQRNHHAVQYHFGSRDRLVQAIFDYRVAPMEIVRSRMVAEAEAAGRLDDVRTLVEIIFLPQLDAVEAHDDVSYASFLCQYLLRNNEKEFGRFGGNLPPSLVKAFAHLRQRLDFLSDHAAQRRLMTASFMFLNLLVTCARERASDDGGEDFPDALKDTLDQIAVAISMPKS